MGRIGTFTIPPPHTVAPLKYCLVHADRSRCSVARTRGGELTMNDSDAIAPLTGHIPGSKEDQTIVFTYARKLSDGTTEPESPSFSKRLAAISSLSE